MMKGGWLSANQVVWLLALGAMTSSVHPSIAAEIQTTQEDAVRRLLLRPVTQITAEQWQSVGDREGINESLIQLALNGDYDGKLRLRAIQALAVFPTRRSQQFLWQVVHDRVLDGSYKRTALAALGAGFQAAVLLELSPFLRKEDPQLREGAIRGLGYIRDPRVLPILQNHVHQEQDLTLRMLVEESIARVQEAERIHEQKQLNRLIEMGTQGDALMNGLEGKEQ